jgi:hypothetical protein
VLDRLSCRPLASTVLLRAELIGSDTAIAAGITVTGVDAEGKLTKAPEGNRQRPTPPNPEESV